MPNNKRSFVMAEDKKPDKDEFVKQFVLTGCRNGRKAAILAGYSEKTADQAASRMLKDVKVLDAIDKHKKMATKKFIWTKEQKLLKFEKVVDAAMKTDPEKGMVNMAAAIAALKEHNIMQGDNAPIVSEQTTTVIQTLSDRLRGGSKR